YGATYIARTPHQPLIPESMAVDAPSCILDCLVAEHFDGQSGTEARDGLSGF
ncbi:hypothetical protein NGA_2090100, partial [Nannochloropsis gaditana CCMP526]|uniref:uncharacterized protein n=1 Tax=Nannochloropsis gaditana (strain CCMP526) TaxID=1093141 RepID=UPI00029F5D1B